jgi:iron complex outermembrane receptor protein
MHPLCSSLKWIMASVLFVWDVGFVLAGAEKYTLEEVVVTARGRTESLQDVSISISAFSNDAIRQQDLKTLEDIAAQTVGMNYWAAPTSGYQSSPTIRGLATGFLADRVQNVATFLNGIYLQRQSMMNVGLADLKRIEILKGPQNSMYGHSAFAGAINYVTEQPTEEFGGYISTTQGNKDRADYRAAINIPLIADKLLSRVSYGRSNFDGHTGNDHPAAGTSAGGFSNEDNLGGWDDETWDVALTARPTKSLEITGEYYRTELQRESQPYYILSGLRDVAATQVGRYDDLNSNEITYSDPIAGLTTGHTMWKGKLPDSSPGAGNCIFQTPQNPCSEPDLRSKGVVVDPRAYGMDTTTEVASINLNWNISESMRLHYLYGWVDHDGSTAGSAERDQLNGSELFDIIATVHSNVSSARPLTTLDSNSHELRLDWDISDKLVTSFGLYYSDVDDEQYDFTVFAPVCSDRDLNNSGSNADEMAGCEVSFDASVNDTPLDEIRINPFWLFSYENWHGNKGNQTRFKEETWAVFASADYQIREDLTLRAEARYTEEERKINRLTDGFSLPAGESGCSPGAIPFCMESSILVPKDDKTFDYFSPRLSLEWHWQDDRMLYASAAGATKSGGFNNAAAPTQQTYDEEENWTFEIGSKNMLFDNQLQLNAALYYIDWNDIQGSEPPEDTSINSAAVIGNIGDATSMGAELNGSWNISSAFSVDFGYAYNDAEYDSGEYDTAQRYLYYNCQQEIVAMGELCGDTDIENNSLPRNSEHQVVGGINYYQAFTAGWQLQARVSGNYQSKQYLTPLNEAHVPSRTLWDANLQLSDGDHWELALWGKNLFDEDYAAGVLNILEQNKYMVSLGAQRTWGARAQYSF